MRLKSVYISQYKNLRDFTLNFDGTSFIDVFVGKNGTGKSNFFEAIIEIFRHLYEFDKNKNRPEIEFTYIIKYIINDVEMEVSWNNWVFTINGEERKTLEKIVLPDNLLIYYSGHNSMVSKLVNSYEETFKKRIKSANYNEARKFIGIGSNYKQLLLAVLLIQNENNIARKFICRKLGINSISPELRLVLNRPFYAKSKTYNIQFNDETDNYWKAEGITKVFLTRLSKCKTEDFNGPIRTEGYLQNDDRYILYFDIKKIQNEFFDLSMQELFIQFDNLKTIEMLKEISITLTLADGTEANINHFSDGQFQSVYIYSIIEIFKDRNCITLLDEPDSFLHPEWQFEFLKQVIEITDTTTKNNHVLMSSHSAVTLVPHEKKKIKFFELNGKNVNCYDLPKIVAIKKLSSDLIKYSEQEQLLSIINAIQIENKPVLFTEGSTDPIIIKEAWYKLFDEEMPFIPFYAFSCTYLSQLLTDNRIINEMNGLPCFGLFDFDKAYNQWNGINGDEIENNPYNGLIKKWKSGNSYAIMLPVPTNSEIQKQVIKDSVTMETFKDSSCCEMEHLFYGSTIVTPYFKQEPCPGGHKIVFKTDSDKTEFAKKIVPKLKMNYFEVFRPMFNFIQSKC